MVLTVDRIDRIADAVLIARRARRIAAQSAWIGMALSAVAMAAAAFGLLPAAVGALLQEVIDPARHRQRTSGAGLPAPTGARIPPERMELLTRTAAEHEAVRPITDRIRSTADGLEQVDGADPPPPFAS